MKHDIDGGTYKEELDFKIKEMLNSIDGLTYFDVLQRFGGADPREVYEIWEKLNPQAAIQASTYHPTKDAITPSILGGTFPAPDSSLGQWTVSWPSLPYQMLL